MKKIQKIISLMRASNKTNTLNKKTSGSLYYASRSGAYAASLPVGFKSRSKSDYFYQ